MQLWCWEEFFLPHIMMQLWCWEDFILSHIMMQLWCWVRWEDFFQSHIMMQLWCWGCFAVPLGQFASERVICDGGVSLCSVTLMLGLFRCAPGLVCFRCGYLYWCLLSVLLVHQDATLMVGGFLSTYLGCLCRVCCKCSVPTSWCNSFCCAPESIMCCDELVRWKHSIGQILAQWIGGWIGGYKTIALLAQVQPITSPIGLGLQVWFEGLVDYHCTDAAAIQSILIVENSRIICARPSLCLCVAESLAWFSFY